MIEKILNSQFIIKGIDITEIVSMLRGLVIWKDLDSIFLGCNTKYSDFMGVHSPDELIGLCDRDVVDKSSADYYKTQDNFMLKTRKNSNYERTVQLLNRENKKERVAGRKILVKDVNGTPAFFFIQQTIKSEPLLNIDYKSRNNIQPLINSIKITDADYNNKTKNKFYLGAYFPDEYFTSREYDAFKQVILGKTIKQIAIALNISGKTAEYHLDNIKRKLRCQYKHEIIAIAIKHGLISPL